MSERAGAPMTDRQFFKGLLAALKVQGMDAIVTRDGRHHDYFARVMDQLAEAHSSGRPGVEAMPDAYAPTAVNNRYRDLTSWLIHLQAERITAAPNPSYAQVNLNLTPDQAERILARFSDDERQLFYELAAAFIEASREDDAVAV